MKPAIALQRISEIRPVRRMGKLIPHSRVVLTNGSHLEMYDDQETYFRELVRFITDVQKGTFKPDAK